MKLAAICESINRERLVADVNLVLAHVFDNTAAADMVGMAARYPDHVYSGPMYRWIAGSKFDATHRDVASWTVSMDALKTVYHNLASARGSIGLILKQEGSGFDVNSFLTANMEYIRQLLEDESLEQLEEYMEEGEIIAQTINPVKIGVTTANMQMVIQ